ncbi:MAG: ATP-binding protein [Phycisphaerales bacterium]|nr:ATP-binding protein [Phycisphaerales bacterium]
MSDRWAGASEVNNEIIQTADHEVKRVKSTPRSQSIEEAKGPAARLLDAQLAAIDRSQARIEFGIDGTILDANQNFLNMIGYNRDEILGQHHRIFLPKDKHDSVEYAEFWQVLRNGEFHSGEFMRLAKDGSQRWIQATYNPVFISDGTIEKFVKYATDITEKKKAEAALAEATDLANAANLSKSEFLANMSHEIRTPLTAILGFTEILSDNLQEPVQQEVANTIRRNGEHLLEIINGILDLSKVESGKMTVETVRESPVQIITDVDSLMKVKADGAGLSLGFEYIGAIPETIQTDPTRLRQILINLIGNAIKFTEVGGVRLITRFLHDEQQPMLQFDVVDTGIGITKAQIATLFQPFSQADTSTTRKFGGTGLGLTISKRFARMLGGDITVVDTRCGVGTRFRLTVATGPLKDVNMLQNPGAFFNAENREGTTEEEEANIQGIRILLAEDGPDNQRLISHLLSKSGADVNIMENGRLAMEAALAARDDGSPFDVILMDMQMPLMDGYQATRRLRDQSYTGPIIALTANAMSGDREKCINAGCNDYATKPVDRKMLVSKIAKLTQGPELVAASTA